LADAGNLLSNTYEPGSRFTRPQAIRAGPAGRRGGVRGRWRPR